MTPQTKHQKISTLITEIQNLKMQVTVKYDEEVAIKARMNEFLAQYQSYLGELDKEVEDFSGKVANAHLQLENLNHLSEPQSAEEQKIPEELLDQVEPVKPVDTDVSQSIENEPGDVPTDESLPLSEINEKEKKEEIRRHFAGFWHPDRNISSVVPKNNFMTVLNTAFDESLDSADLLAAIPWDTAWEQRKSGESIGDQWERLTDWYTGLEIANERLDQKIALVKNDWRYPLFSDWDKGSEKQDFFTGLANQKRDEIKSLESTLQILLQEIQVIQSNGVG